MSEICTLMYNLALLFIFFIFCACVRFRFVLVCSEVCPDLETIEIAAKFGFNILNDLE